MKDERTGEMALTMKKPANDILDLIVGNGNENDSIVESFRREDPALRGTDLLPEKPRRLSALTENRADEILFLVQGERQRVPDGAGANNCDGQCPAWGQ